MPLQDGLYDVPEFLWGAHYVADTVRTVHLVAVRLLGAGQCSWCGVRSVPDSYMALGLSSFAELAEGKVLPGRDNS